MRVCLINPAQVLQKRFGRPFVFQPTGLLYAAAAVEKEFPVEVIDASLPGLRAAREEGGKYCLGLTFQELKDKIGALNPDVIGISCLFSINESSALQTARAVKEVRKDIPVIFGGVHPSMRPEEVISCGYVDFAVIGEGERTLPELLRVLAGGDSSSLSAVRGIAYKDKSGRIELTPAREKIQDLDALAFPARHLVPMEEYFLTMETGRGARQMYTYSRRWASVITSRGCPYQCNFCSIHLSMGRQFRKRSPENVIEELKHLKRAYDIKHINFEDDNLTLDKERAESIFDLMIKENLNLSWSTPNGIRGDALDEVLIRKMKESGCKRVFLAPESGSQYVVNNIIKKNMDLKKVEKAVRLFKKYEIIVDGSFVLGSIGETRKDVWKTIRYALRLKGLGMQAAGFHIATPYYGTALYEEAQRKGLLREDLDGSLFTTTEPLISTREWTGDQIRRLRDIADWLVNYKFRNKMYYFLRWCPGLWLFFAWSKKMALFLIRLPINAYHWFLGMGRYFLNAFVRILSELTHKPPYPEYIVYEVTDACNSRCQHCSIWKHKPSENILSPIEIEKIFSQEFFSRVKSVLLTGGEAVLRNDIKELISAVHKALPNAALSLSSNGLLADKLLETVRYAINNGIKLNVGISLDAAGDNHDAIRGVKGNFARVDYLLKELSLLKEANPGKIGIIIGHTLSNLTVDTLKEVMCYAQGLGINCISQLYEEFIYYHNVDNEKAANYRKSDNIRLIKAIEDMPPLFHNEVVIAALKHRLKFRCSALRKFFLLRSDGSVAPCLCYSDISAGNLKSNPAVEIWNSMASERIRNLVRKCSGCSNSWATTWSKEEWIFPFLGIMVRTKLKSLLVKLKRNKDV